MSCPSFEAWLEAIDSGTGSPPAAHLDCGACRTTEASARELLQTLRDGIPRSSLSDERFMSRVIARGRTDGRRRVPWFAAPLAAAAALLLARYIGSEQDDASELVARGDTAPAVATCEVALVTPQGLQFLHDGDRVPEAAKLAFRVRNPARKTRWLGVFGVGVQRRVGWYHPAYETAEEEPRTLPMPVGDEAWLLDESVALKLGPGPVRIVCWQADHPSSVRTVDTRIEAALSDRADLRAWTRVEDLGGEQVSILLWFDSSH